MNGWSIIGPKSLNVTCNNVKIGCKQSVSYLGAELESNLSGEEMACKILKRVNSRVNTCTESGIL